MELTTDNNLESSTWYCLTGNNVVMRQTLITIIKVPTPTITEVRGTFVIGFCDRSTSELKLITITEVHIKKVDVNIFKIRDTNARRLSKDGRY